MWRFKSSAAALYYAFPACLFFILSAEMWSEQKKNKTPEFVSLNSFEPGHAEIVCIDYFRLAHQKDLIIAEICWCNIDSGNVQIDVRAFL